MEAVYKRLITVLGQPPEGGVLRQLIDESGKELINANPMYTIPKLGVSFFEFDGLIKLVVIHVDTPETRQGTVNTYKGDLPYGLHLGDGQEIIEQKFALKPESPESLLSRGINPKDRYYTYVQPPLVLQFVFPANTKKLSSIRIGLSDISG